MSAHKNLIEVNNRDARVCNMIEVVSKDTTTRKCY